MSMNIITSHNSCDGDVFCTSPLLFNELKKLQLSTMYGKFANAKPFEHKRIDEINKEVRRGL